MFKSYVFNKLRDYFTRSETDNFVLLFFITIDIFFISKLAGSSAWLTLSFLFISSILLSLKIKDLITSFLLTAVYTFQLYVPNKYYIVEVFKPHELLNGVGRYLLSYGLNLKNIFLLGIIILIFRNLVLKKINLREVQLAPLLPVFISGIIFFFVSLYSSLRFSPFFELSLVWLLHYSQMFIVGFLILYVYCFNKHNFNLVAPVILSSVFLQSFISIMQFIKQSWWGLPIESATLGTTYYGSSDAVSSIFRVAGTFGQANQLGLVMLVSLILIIPITLNHKKPQYIIGAVLAVLTIILTQSRSAWIALFFVFLLTIVMYRKSIKNIIILIGTRRLLLFVLVGFMATSIVFVPRLTASLNAFTEEGGATVRREMLREGISAFQQNQWIGYGIGTNEYTLLRMFPTGYVYWFPAPVHQAYLQLILESGILGFVSFIFSFVYIIRVVVNKYLTHGAKDIKKNKDYVFVTFAGVAAFGLFYLFQPHEGIRDFYYLGIILGFGLISMRFSNKRTR